MSNLLTQPTVPMLEHVDIELNNGHQFKMVFGFSGLSVLDSEHNISPDDAQKCVVEGIRMEQLPQFLHAGLYRHHHFTLADVKGLMEDVRPGYMRDKVWDALYLAFITDPTKNAQSAAANESSDGAGSSPESLPGA
jgi:hypothetical protein